MKMNPWFKATLSGLICGFSTVAVLVSLSSCSSFTQRKPATQDVVNLDELPEDEKLLYQWQEERSQNYFDWPVDQARLTRGFLPEKRRPHLGIDLAGPKGTPVLAAHDGVVIYAGRDFRGFGNMVLIEGSRGWASLYAHFHKIEVKEGQRVKQGQRIGQMGRTGRATGVHLHFEVRKTRGPVDPLLYLPGGLAVARHLEE
ncbi:MAG: M23 family metallopeptidase [Proteobacteria bacterium]|jgi:murein DD-endopeptidase MepM/ murein hydrolase activator NlpD|nr:M23 family metallopeptidase [Pseudomonadota bacterium]